MPYNNALVSENFWKLFFQNPENPHKHRVFWHFQKVCPYLTQADDLGRVVIPKEIRRTMRIREGDPLEIFTNNDGEVIFKKYSPMGELASFSADFASALSESTSLAVIICDRDHCIAVGGAPKRELLEKTISAELEKIVEDRKIYTNNNNEIYAVDGCERKICVVAPIISAGDITGCVALLENNGCSEASDTDIKLAAVAARFLGSRTE